MPILIFTWLSSPYAIKITDPCLCCVSILPIITTMYAPEQAVRSGAPDTMSYETNFKFGE